jgi:hypothetical protein
MRTAVLVGVAAVLFSGAACRKKDDSVVPVPASEPARRVAMSFVHCVETGSSTCVRSNVRLGGWDAFFLLGWLSDGSPTSILQTLDRELRSHGDPALVQSRFVQLVERYGRRLRGAECDPVGAQEMAPLVRRVAEIAEKRLSAFGLWGGDLTRVIRGLQSEAEQSLQNGYLVRMQCRNDPYQVYVVTAESNGRQNVVGMTIMLPEFLSGEGSNRDTRGPSRGVVIQGGQDSIPLIEGTVHTWLPIPLEVF